MYQDKNIALVSLADDKYFHLLEDLIESINRFDQSKFIKICVLDAGLKIDQIDKIKSKVFKIEKANWDIKVSEHRIRGREGLKSMICRPFIPNYFPEFDKYIWIDCDAWVNSWVAIDHLIKGSENNKISIVCMSDRHTGRVLKVKWLFRNVGFIKSQNLKHGISSGYSFKDTHILATQPHINTGVFALNKSSPIWKRWQENTKISAQKGRIFASEQIAMNYTIYIENFEAELLPYYCNWIPLKNMTLWDDKKNTFVEKYYPNNEIGIMHLAGGVFVNNSDMRFDKSLKIEIPTTSGKIIKKSLRYCID